MCGITGFVTSSPDAPPDSLLARMTGILRHRGPDACGYYRDAFASLGHRRLSIIDVRAGHQPMSNEDGSLWIVYNGEIFNHADLRPALEQAGHRYQTRCDTETILHAYEQYGPDCVSRGFAACSRLRSGTATPGRSSARATAWAKSLSTTIGMAAYSLSLPRSRRCWSIPRFAAFEESLSGISDFGYCSAGSGHCLSGIRKLMPGHWLMRRTRGTRLETGGYWEVPVPASTLKGATTNNG